MIQFCTGSPTCTTCGGAHTEGMIQNCPRNTIPYTPPIGWGTKLAMLIAKVRRKKSACNSCAKREQKLNRFGFRVSSLFSKALKLVYDPKAKRRKKLANSPLSFTQENLDKVAAKNLRRQKLLEVQNLS